MVRLDIRPNRMIMVDLEGKRFVDESGYRSKIAEAILSLPEQHCWSISDSDTVSSFDVTIQKNLYRNLFAGHIFRADTLEKLAQQIQVPPASLRSSVLSVSQSRHINPPPLLGCSRLPPNSYNPWRTCYKWQGRVCWFQWSADPRALGRWWDGWQCSRS